MCVNSNVNLPTVISFLMLYSLRCGSVTTFLWTTLRSLFCLSFFMVSIVEVFLLVPTPLGAKIIVHADKAPNEELYFFIFYSYIFMIITEALLFVHMLHLAVGLFNDSSNHLAIYLICRFFTLLSEILFLVILCWAHKLLIGWYLGFLLFVVLEFYAFIVVYSYYADLRDEECRNKCNRDAC